jgi:hypothetical protein
MRSWRWLEKWQVDNARKLDLERTGFLRRAATDAGNPNGCTDGSGHLLTTDQRGYPRHDPEYTGGCDMGIYES